MTHHGIKSLAQDLAQYGRNGDTMVAHINPQEAAMLKAMGGSGTINPTTGLPEFGGVFKSITRPFVQTVKSVQNLPGIKQVSDVATQAVKPIDQALVGLDKTVGKAIPGGWGTLASIAGSAVGVPAPLLIGLGALNGAGVMHPGRKFNLQGALIGGAMAYGMSELGNYARAAAPAVEGVGTVADGFVQNADGIYQSVADLQQGATIPDMSAFPQETAPLVQPQAGPPSPVPDLSPNMPAVPEAASAQPTFKINPETGEQYIDPASLKSPNTFTQSLMKGNVSDAFSTVGSNISDALVV